MHAYRSAALAVAFTVACAWTSAIAQDVEGSKDHPVLGRYEGTTIEEYEQAEFDETKLLQVPADKSVFGAGFDALREPEWIKLEGRITKIAYLLPEKTSSLQVLRNYETALKEKGFAPVFACVDANCNHDKQVDVPTYLSAAIWTRNELRFAVQGPVRYSLMKADLPTGPTYVAMLFGVRGDSKTHAYVTVFEGKAMEGNKIKPVTSGELEKSIKDTGKVDIYGILFDFDKADIRPDSKPVLDEIGKLLTGSADLKLKIVGHTDNKGADDYNRELSERRAASVVASLTQDYSIAADRLSSSGAGAGQPVAPNDTDDNRAKNRRVELVKQ